MTIWLWLSFLVLICGLLALDLGVFHRRLHAVRTREALAWTGFWVVLALAFNVLVYFMYARQWFISGEGPASVLTGGQAALQFLTGYAVEKSLSVDNIFVIAVVFSHFRVPPAFQHRVLFWGILGALIMRGAMIAAGVSLISRFEWVIYVFGGLLLVAAVKTLFAGHGESHPERNILVRLARKLLPVAGTTDEPHFVIRVQGRWAITPLFIVLLIIESSDVLFAIDSVPAVLAVTRDPFIAFTSNVFAILGLRSLYFALAGMLERFHYLKVSLSMVLAFVGIKMLLSEVQHIPTVLSLGIIAALMGLGTLASILLPRKTAEATGGEGHEGSVRPSGSPLARPSTGEGTGRHSVRESQAAEPDRV